MQLSHLLAVGAVLAGLGVALAVPEATGPSANALLPEKPEATGHYVLVVEGDRDQLAVTHVSHKTDPWAGVPKGFASEWTLSIRDAAGTELAVVPLDLSKFDLDPAHKGKPLRVQGCIVEDARIAMLTSVPCFAAAASYTFARGKTAVGVVDGAVVRHLAGGGR